MTADDREIRFHGALEPGEFEAVHRILRPSRGGWTDWLLAFVVVGVTGVFASRELTVVPGGEWMPAVLIGAGLLLVPLVVLAVRGTRREPSRQALRAARIQAGAPRRPSSGVVRLDHIEIADDSGSTRLPWTAFAKFVRTEDLVLLVEPSNEALVFHRRHFGSEEDWLLLLSRIRKRLPEGSPQ